MSVYSGYIERGLTMQTFKHITIGLLTGLTIGVLLMIGANSMGAVVAVTILPTLEPMEVVDGHE